MILQRGYWLVPKWGVGNNRVGKKKFDLPNNYVPVTTLMPQDLQEDNAQTKIMIYSLNEELEMDKNTIEE